MTASPVNLRNLEQIHEGSAARSPRLATFLLGATGVAAVLVTGVLLQERSGQGEETALDPLAVLVAEAEAAPANADEGEVNSADIGFPDLLSDSGDRTTALVAVRDRKGRLTEQPPSADEPLVKPDGLTTSPLPAGDLLNATQVTTQPGDQLTQLASDSSRVSEDATMSAPGSPGGFVIQVASFKNQDDADRFVDDLRKRGHKAFRQAANVPGRGLWHRVRIGSFKTKYQATLYKAKLEEKERISALVIDPDKVERQEKIRAAKLAERIRKYGNP